MQSTQELPCSGVKTRNGVTAERGVSLISVVQLIFADVEATGEVKWVVHARRGAAIVTLDAGEIVLMELSCHLNRSTDFSQLCHQQRRENLTS